MLSSILLGTPGNYEINGILVNFGEHAEGDTVFGNSWFGHAVNRCLNNSVVRFLTLGYLHVFIHEMGHAFAAQMNGVNSTVNIYTQHCRGDTLNPDRSKFTALAGPLAGMALETIKLVGAIAAAVLLPPVVGLPLGILLGAGAVFWLFGEMMYAWIGHGDWDIIRR